MAFTVRTATAATAALMLASAVRAAPNGGKQLGSILAMGGGGWQMGAWRRAACTLRAVAARIWRLRVAIRRSAAAAPCWIGLAARRAAPRRDTARACLPRSQGRSARGAAAAARVPPPPRRLSPLHRLTARGWRSRARARAPAPRPHAAPCAAADARLALPRRSRDRLWRWRCSSLLSGHGLLHAGAHRTADVRNGRERAWFRQHGAWCQRLQRPCVSASALASAAPLTRCAYPRPRTGVQDKCGQCYEVRGVGVRQSEHAAMQRRNAVC